MLIGGFNAIYEQKIKRFIAYSSINQIGFLFIGLLGTKSSIQGIEAFIYFFGTYIVNLTLFLNIIIYFTKFKYY
jgi:NADH:ubiquinone oxidoreductase subunit 2 (subunit N)